MIVGATAVELARRIRAREVSPVEVLEDTIERIEAIDPQINAFVFKAFDEARERARRMESALIEGGPLGPLHGVPTALKDLFDFHPGWPATFGGIRALARRTVDARCNYCQRMDDSGAIIVGKTNSPVMGFRATCDNPLFGPTRNPFDLARNSGGSSGGSAAAVAAGMLTVAEGSDGGGSIRIPAACCGIYGFKPSAGRVPNLARPNAFIHGTPFLGEGPLTRTVQDAAHALSVLAVHEPRDPLGLPDDGFDPIAAIERPIAGMRIAYSPRLDVFPVDPRVGAVVDAAARRFEEAGAHVEEVTLGLRRSHDELADLWCRLIIVSSLYTFQRLRNEGIDVPADHADDLPPAYREWLQRGRSLSAVDVFEDNAIRTEVWDAVQAVFADHDLLVCPTIACPPVPNATDGDTTGPSEVDGTPVDPLTGWTLTAPFNLTGHPAASIPAGMIDGLPVGMQIVGRRAADGDVLAASAAFERIAPWRHTYNAIDRAGATPTSR